MVHVVAEGLLMRQKSITSGCQATDSPFNSLLLYWKLMKSKPLLITMYSVVDKG